MTDRAREALANIKKRFERRVGLTYADWQDMGHIIQAGIDKAVADSQDRKCKHFWPSLLLWGEDLLEKLNIHPDQNIDVALCRLSQVREDADDERDLAVTAEYARCLKACEGVGTKNDKMAMDFAEHGLSLKAARHTHRAHGAAECIEAIKAGREE